MTGLFPEFRYGGDYNPEQWPEEVWDDDVRLMRGAAVTTATVGVFSWARLEPRPGEFDFGWLDRVLAKLDAGGIRVMMATATASPPAWLAVRYPETLPVDERGVRLGFGSRQQYSPNSSVYREHASRLVRAIAERYRGHPAIEAWHVNNELGCHVVHSYDPESVAAFRAWLETRYGTIDELNRAWGTAFWSQRYDSFAEVDAPRAMPSFTNPTHSLDWRRFGSWSLLELYLMERDILREVAPGLPITTNLMGFFPGADYWEWAPELDFISDDAYPDPTDPDAYVTLAAQRDLTRSLGGGRPWLLMEQSPSAVNWRDRNARKQPGQHRAHSFNAVARGADGILHFQWRQAAAGAEKFHAAMVPHGGEHTRIHREARELGAELAELSATDVLGAAVPARVAIVFDWESWWALAQQAVPTRIDYPAVVLEWYAALLRRGVTVDFTRAGADHAGYDIVIAPALQVASRADLDGLAAVADRGAQLVVGYQTGILDRDLHAYLGGYLGGEGSALQHALGVSVEEFAPLAAGQTAVLDDGTTVTDWQEVVQVADAEVVARFATGPVTGGPAITRHGSAWYVATQPDSARLDALIDQILVAAGVDASFPAPVSGVETVVRGSTRFVINHSPDARTVEVAGQQVDLDSFGVARLTA
ncbi:MAG: beta-galactosidase [Pseudolysinimonas sp.]|uniref:beta-galactosidase n=1 Tax=Pseudolysinimonas sp. TaxID=2680009 RepID=UPI003263214A